MDKNRIQLNDTELMVSKINLGTNVFGWTVDEKTAHEILDEYYNNGFNFLDTADTYPWWVNGVGGLSESMIGNWLLKRKNRHNIIIATKVGSHNKEHDYDISEKHILKSIDESLQRLKTDYVDIYYTHFDDKRTPVEETLLAYNKIIKQGKVRYIAASNISPERLMESMHFSSKNGVPKYIALQPHYNLVERENYESNYLPLVEEYNLSVFPYWSLASGFLTGKYQFESDLEKSVRGGAVKKYLNEKGLAIIKALNIISKKHNCSQATIALAWLLAQPSVNAPIVSASNLNQLKEILKAPLIKLDEGDLKQLDIK